MSAALELAPYGGHGQHGLPAGHRQRGWVTDTVRQEVARRPELIHIDRHPGTEVAEVIAYLASGRTPHLITANVITTPLTTVGIRVSRSSPTSSSPRGQHGRAISGNKSVEGASGRAGERLTLIPVRAYAAVVVA